MGGYLSTLEQNDVEQNAASTTTLSTDANGLNQYEAIPIKYKKSPLISSKLNKGYAIIFNHKTFKPGLSQEERTGTEYDVSAIIETFEQYKIIVKVNEDFTLDYIESEVQRLRKFDFTPYDCFVIVILTHGLENNTLCAYDCEYKLHQTIVNPIVNTNATLAGKPKLFIIQACKGSSTPTNYYRNDSFSGNVSVLVPALSDMFYAFSTYEGYTSFRHIQYGGVFIQKLCEIIKKYGSNESITTIMEIVTKELIEENNNQVPTVITTMTRPFLFGDIGKRESSEMADSFKKGYILSIFDPNRRHRELKEKMEMELNELRQTLKFFNTFDDYKTLSSIREIEMEITKLCNYDFSSYDYFMIVLTGYENDLHNLFVDLFKVDFFETIVYPIVRRNQTLKGKSKIFILDMGYFSPFSFNIKVPNDIPDMFFVSTAYKLPSNSFINILGKTIKSCGSTEILDDIVNIAKEKFNKNKQHNDGTLTFIKSTMKEQFSFGNFDR